MAIRINFDSTHNVQSPTYILVTRSGRKLGKLPAYNITFKSTMGRYSEIFFRINKADCVSNSALWNQTKDFKLMYCKEYNALFEIYVEVDETNHLIKNVTAKSLGEAELSQINLYGIEINTEQDISRNDYKPTVLFNNLDPDASLLDRITRKAPHYKIGHVDPSIANIQRTFSFDATTIYDAFQTISKEINCLFVINASIDSDGKICRIIEAYDLESYCQDCGNRGEFADFCPECNSGNIVTGYGKDTSILISTENLAENIQFSTNVDSVKNCFKLTAGDELMTATLINCNPSGTDYIWHISDEIKEDMSAELVDRLNAYDDAYAYYQKEYFPSLNETLLSDYNSLAEKYRNYNEDIETITVPIIGYANLMNAYYNTIDLHLFLSSGLMPNVSMQSTSAAKEITKLNNTNLSPVAVQNIEKISATTASSAVLAMAKVLVDARYQVKIKESKLYGTNWAGIFTVTNYSDEEDTATTDEITIAINDNYEDFVKQKIEKSLNKDASGDIDNVSLFELDASEFCAEIKKYSLSCLESFHDACQACLDILIEQGVANKETWEQNNSDLYEKIYIPYYNKLSYLSNEIKIREAEISIITGIHNHNGELVADGLQTVIGRERNIIQNILNFQNFIGEDLWIEFAAYRREDTYQNDNYISDGLNNAELFKNALKFIEVAKKDIFKSSTLQHSIKATLKNLLVMKEFTPIVDYFEIGNWIRVRVDGNIYKLRIIEYEIDYDNLPNISITFSDVISDGSVLSDAESILSQASSMASSYGAVTRQANQGKKSNEKLSNWAEKGLSLSNMKIVGNTDDQSQTWDNHGMLFRQYDPIDDAYEDVQLKIVNSTMSITDDNWKTVKTAIGLYYYFDPETGKLKKAYGVNGEAIIGKLFLGEQLGIYNENGSLSFNKDGFRITNNTNSFRVNPNSDVLLAISNGDKDVFYIDADGTLHISADGSGIDVSANSEITAMQSQTIQNKEAITKETQRATDAENDLRDRIAECSSQIKINADSITGLVTKTDGLATSLSELEQYIKIDSTSEHIHINAKVGNVYIGNSGTSDVEIGAEDKNVYLKGNIYINGVLYTAST